MKSQKQANFLHALNSDQKKGMAPSQMLSAPMAGGLKPAQGPITPQMVAPKANPMPVPMIHMPQPSAPKLMPPPSQPMGNSNVPALPMSSKLPKFGKMRNSLKGGPFKKS